MINKIAIRLVILVSFIKRKKCMARMNWFKYLECPVLPCIAIVEIIVLTLLYRQRNKKRNRQQTYFIASLCILELNGVSTIIFTHIIFGRISLLVNAIVWFYLLLYHDNIDCRSAFSVLFKHKIPYCMASLCDFIYHLEQLCVSFCFQDYRMDASLPNYVYPIFHLGYDIYCTGYYYIFLYFSEMQEKQKTYERTNK